MKETIIYGLVALVLCAAGLVDYFSLPIVGTNQSGICVYVEIGGKKQTCEHLPPRYIDERVAGW